MYIYIHIHIHTYIYRGDFMFEYVYLNACKCIFTLADTCIQDYNITAHHARYHARCIGAQIRILCRCHLGNTASNIDTQRTQNCRTSTRSAATLNDSSHGRVRRRATDAHRLVHLACTIARWASFDFVHRFCWRFRIWLLLSINIHTHGDQRINIQLIFTHTQISELIFKNIHAHADRRINIQLICTHTQVGELIFHWFSRTRRSANLYSINIHAHADQRINVSLIFDRKNINLAPQHSLTCRIDTRVYACECRYIRFFFSFHLRLMFHDSLVSALRGCVRFLSWRLCI